MSRINKDNLKAIKKRDKDPNNKTEFSFIKILTGSDLSNRRLPIMSIKSINPGPIVWLTACVHGDEVGSMVVTQEIFRKIKKRGLLKGTIYAFPLLNPLGFENYSRNITLSKEDINRTFPGKEKGSLAEMIAYKIFNTIIETKPALVLDLHNDWRRSIPYTILDPMPEGTSKDVYNSTKVFGKKTEFPLILDTDDINTSLAYNMLKKNIPSLTLELGESYVVNETDVKYGVGAVWNVLAYLQMVNPLEKPLNYRMPIEVKDKILIYSQEPCTSSSGIIRFLVKPEDIVRKGDPIAKIYNSIGKLVETLNALEDGIVLGYSDSSLAFPGAAIMAFGVFKKEK